VNRTRLNPRDPPALRLAPTLVPVPGLLLDECGCFICRGRGFLKVYTRPAPGATKPGHRYEVCWDCDGKATAGRFVVHITDVPADRPAGGWCGGWCQEMNRTTKSLARALHWARRVLARAHSCDAPDWLASVRVVFKPGPPRPGEPAVPYEEVTVAVFAVPPPPRAA
jgi:hypothetical protein